MRFSKIDIRALRRPAIVLLALVGFAACAAAAMATDQLTQANLPYKVVGKWGGTGNAPGKFTGAHGLAIDKTGNVYVADTDQNRIQSFSAKGAFKKVFAFSDDGTVPDVAVGPDGGVWGSTDVNGQVVRFPAGPGTPLTTPKSALGIAVDADGNVYASSSGDDVVAVVRFGKSASGWEEAKTWASGGGLQAPGDIEVSPDGTVYVADTRGSPPNVKRYDSSGKLLKAIKLPLPATAGAGEQLGIGVDPDCNLWVNDHPQRRIDKFTPSGKLLGTVTAGDLLALDIAFGPQGDLYVFDQNGPYTVVHFAEDRSKPQAAAVGGSVTVTKGAAKVKYTLSGVACPAQISAVASLSGKGISGRATVKVAAGKTTVISIPVKAAKGSTSAQFKIVLETNGRPTTQTRSVKVTVK